MQIDPDTGMITWTPTPGIFDVLVTAEDPAGLGDVQSFTLSVNPANQPPSITSLPGTTAVTECGLFSYDVDATDPNLGDTLTFSLKVAPPYMTIDPAAGVIQWVSGKEQRGANDVTVQVEDQDGLSAEQSFTITVIASTAAVYDLACDWSDQNNPNGPWSYNDGPAHPIQNHWDDWDSGQTLGQPAWSTTQYPFQGHVPVWFKMQSPGFASQVDLPVGRVGMHGTSGNSSLVNTPAGVSWTSLSTAESRYPAESGWRGNPAGEEWPGHSTRMARPLTAGI